MLVVLTGGARSGKSSAAVAAATANGGDVVMIATAEAGDQEMAARIRSHQAQRPGGWVVVEEPRDLTGAIVGVDPHTTLVIDCLALWVSNRLGDTDSDLLAESDTAVALLASRPGTTIVVTNEVGSGIVPVNATARRFRDLLGAVNQTFARSADTAYLCVAGRLLELQAPEAISV